MSARAKDPKKPLSKDARKRAIAQQTLWAVVDRYTGKIDATRDSRSAARQLAAAEHVVELLNVRVQGMRA